MRKLRLLKERLESLRDVLVMRKVIEILQMNEHLIVIMNTQYQLYDEGMNRDGEYLADTKPYKPYTIHVKKIKGQPYDRVTLQDEGDFYDSFYVEFGAEEMTIRAGDLKTEELTLKYGSEILGLTKENISILAQDQLRPELHKFINNYLLWGKQ